MKRAVNSIVILSLLGAGLSSAVAETIAIRAERIHTVSGAPIDDAVIVVEGGRIRSIAPAASADLRGVERTLQAKVVTPGLIDVHTVVGFAGIYNSASGQVQDQDQLETSDPLQPELRAVDAYDPVEPLVEWLRAFGVTTIHTGHGPGAVISGQTMIASTRGGTVEQVLLQPATAVAATLGGSVSENFESPGTAAKCAAMLREALVAAQAYREKLEGDEPPDRNLRHETMVRVLDGELALMITAHGAAEIATALRLQREFGFRLWLDGAAEAYRMIEPIREAGVPVLLHATMLRPTGDAKNVAYDTAARLAEAGIPFAIQSGFESYVPKARVVLYEAQVAVHHGLAPERALRAITLDAATILGIADRLSSIEVGKQADLVLFDGDPFEYTSHACAVLIGGEVVSGSCR